jgi:hypothetical protein
MTYSPALAGPAVSGRLSGQNGGRALESSATIRCLNRLFRVFSAGFSAGFFSVFAAGGFRRGFLRCFSAGLSAGLSLTSSTLAVGLAPGPLPVLPALGGRHRLLCRRRLFDRRHGKFRRKRLFILPGDADFNFLHRLSRLVIHHHRQHHGDHRGERHRADQAAAGALLELN